MPQLSHQLLFLFVYINTHKLHIFVAVAGMKTYGCCCFGLHEDRGICSLDAGTASNFGVNREVVLNGVGLVLGVRIRESFLTQVSTKAIVGGNSDYIIVDYGRPVLNWYFDLP